MRRTLVLDIDECLVRSHDKADGIAKGRKMMESVSVADRRSFFKASIKTRTKTITFWGVKRPNLDNFLYFAEKYFATIIVWSAGEYRYVHSVVDVLFKHHKYPDAILTRDDIVGEDYDYHKPLEVIMKKHPGMAFILDHAIVMTHVYMLRNREPLPRCFL